MRLKIRSQELRRRRLQKLMSQEVLAEKSGVSASNISKLELSNAGVLTQTVKALADALECDPFDIAEIDDKVEGATA